MMRNDRFPSEFLLSPPVQSSDLKAIFLMLIRSDCFCVSLSTSFGCAVPRLVFNKLDNC